MMIMINLINITNRTNFTVTLSITRAFIVLTVA